MVSAVRCALFSIILTFARAADVESQSCNNKSQCFANRRCTLDRISSISTTKFNRAYRLSRPFVLVNHSLGPIPDEMTSSVALADHFKDLLLTVAPISHLARGNFKRNERAEAEALDVTISQYTGKGRVAHDAEATAARQHSTMERTAKSGEIKEGQDGQYDQVVEPKYLYHILEDSNTLPFKSRTMEDNRPKFLEDSDEWEEFRTFLGVGSAGEGLSWHTHRASWHQVLYGERRWVMYPFKTYPPGGFGDHLPTSEWVDRVQPGLADDQRPEECVLGPGELLYIPEAWHHAWTDLKDTAAVSTEATGDIQTEAYENFVTQCEGYPDQCGDTNSPSCDKMYLDAVGFCEKVLMESNHFVPAILNMGAHNLRFGRKTRAMNNFKRAVKANPMYRPALTNLLRLLVQEGQAAEARVLVTDSLKLMPGDAFMEDAKAHLFQKSAP